MVLKLVVTNKGKLLADLSSQIEFDEKGGSIGRSPLNKWIVCDQQRFVSSRHANIIFRDGQFYITDNSTNGVFINKNSQPLGNNNSAPLKNGDRIQIGELEIAVEMANAAKQTYAPSSFSNAPNINDDFLSGLGIADAKSQTANDGFPDLSDLINVSSKPAAIATTTGDDILDPLALLGSPTPAPKKSFATLDTGDTPLNEVSPMPYSPTSPVNQPMDIPRASQNTFTPSSQNFLPDDWDSLDLAPTPVQTIPATAKPSVEAEYTPVIAPPPSPTMQPDAVTPIDSRTSIREILSAAGIDPASLGDKAEKLAPQLFGAMLRATMDGLVTTLLARSQIKSGMRMSVTMIGQRENNPLKFSVNGEEALHNLLQQRAGYLDPVTAIEKGFEDLQAHQLAVMAATQATILAVFERFNPTNLANEFDKLKSQTLFASKKAHYWECYEDYFEKLHNEIRDDFQTVLGSTFADAYQAQINKL